MRKQPETQQGDNGIRWVGKEAIALRRLALARRAIAQVKEMQK
jgi:hypothetical protein